MDRFLYYFTKNITQIALLCAQKGIQIRKKSSILYSILEFSAAEGPVGLEGRVVRKVVVRKLLKYPLGSLNTVSSKRLERSKIQDKKCNEKFLKTVFQPTK